MFSTLFILQYLDFRLLCFDTMWFFNFELFGFWFGYVLFMILVGYDLYFVIDLCPLHYNICFDSQVLWLFDVAKGGEKWGVERLKKSLEIK